jgi:GT2 family glycosyltransferase
MDTLMISICILTYNRANYLCNLLSSLSHITKFKVEIIVIDNNSSDNTNIIVSHFPFVIYHKTESNIGVSARNIGIRKASGNIIITIDDDVIGINDEVLDKLITIFDNNKHLGALNFKVIDYNTNIMSNWIHHCKSEENENSYLLTYEISEGAVAFRKDVFDFAGYYAESFFLSHEGIDLAVRIINSGYEVRYTGDITLLHYHATAGRKPWYRYYYDTRNLFWVAVRNFPIVYAIKYISRGLISTMIYSIRDLNVLYWIKGVYDGIIGIEDCLKYRVAISKRTLDILVKIDNNRPPIMYMIKKRLFKKGMRL